MCHGHCWSVTFTGSVLNGRFPTPYVRETVPTAGYCPKYPVFPSGRAETFSLFSREFESIADWRPLPRLFWMKIWHLTLRLLHFLVEVIKCLPVLFCDKWLLVWCCNELTSLVILGSEKCQSTYSSPWVTWIHHEQFMLRLVIMVIMLA
jgi:hypothetical protein